MAKNKNWIFLRGLGRNSGHWGPFVGEFQTQFPGHQIELLDLPGSGTEAHRQSPGQMDPYVTDLRSRRKTQGPVSLLAISMGAMVATRWAELFPEEIESLILINTNGKGLAPFYERLQFKNYLQMLNMFMNFKDRRSFEKVILEMTAQDLPDFEATLERHLRLPETSMANWLRQVTVSAQFQFPSRPPVSQVLILSARQDQLVSCKCSEMLAQNWNVPHRQHPKGAHDLPLIDSPWVIQQIKDFQ